MYVHMYLPQSSKNYCTQFCQVHHAEGQLQQQTQEGRVGVGLEGFTSLQTVWVHLILMYSKIPGIVIQL